MTGRLSIALLLAGCFDAQPVTMAPVDLERIGHAMTESTLPACADGVDDLWYCANWGDVEGLWCVRSSQVQAPCKTSDKEIAVPRCEDCVGLGAVFP
jgi:hypothetical protein